MNLTRRDALRGGTASLAAIAAGGAVVASEPFDAALDASADWWGSWNRVREFISQLPNDVFDGGNYTRWYLDNGGAKIMRAYDDAEGRLLQAEPTTIVGATAVLGCAAEIIRVKQIASSQREGDRRAARLALDIFCIRRPEFRVVQIAHKALERLAGRAS